MDRMKRIIARKVRSQDDTKVRISEDLRYHISRIEELLGRLERNINVTESIRRELDKIDEIFEKYGEEIEEVPAGEYLQKFLRKEQR
ncbi:MAG TPA: hypothetical protein P5140_05545 [Methanofastidiosum sp.]|nr:hypothetical protein [Methanofastidiosum sp.]